MHQNCGVGPIRLPNQGCFLCVPATLSTCLKTKPYVKMDPQRVPEINLNQTYIISTFFW